MFHGWTNLSSSVDSVFLFIMGISLVLLVGVTGTMVYFAVRYRRSKHPRAENIEGNLALEIVWTVIPTLLVLAIFWVGWKGFVYHAHGTGRRHAGEGDGPHVVLALHL